MELCIFMFVLGCKEKEVDIVFLLDSSTSIGTDRFQKIKDFVVGVVDQFTIGPQDTRVGVIVFNDIATVEFSLDTYNTSHDVILATQGIAFVRGKTNTASGLNLLAQEFVAKGRPASQRIPRIAIVVTDGKSSNSKETALAAPNVHQNSIITYVVGIGGIINQTELSLIAGSTGKVENLAEFDATELKSLQSDINQDSCKGNLLHWRSEILRWSFISIEVSIFIGVGRC